MTGRQKAADERSAVKGSVRRQDYRSAIAIGIDIKRNIEGD